MIKSVKPRIAGTVVRVAEDQPEYQAVDVVRVVDGDYSTPMWQCPRCRRVRPQSMPGCKGDVEIDPHALVDRPELHNTVIMAFDLSPEDRHRIRNGEDLYIALLTFGQPQQPILVSVGPEELAARYGLGVLARPLAGPVQMDCGESSKTDTSAAGADCSGCGPGCECHPSEN